MGQRNRAWLAVLVMCLTGSANVATADEARARSLLEQAISARDEGRLGDAERLLRESLEEHEWSYPAFELANVLSRMRRHASALKIYEALRDGQYGEVAGNARRTLRTTIREIRPLVSVLSISWSGEEPTVRVDGLIIEHRGSELELRLDPGPHVVTFDVPGQPTVEREVQITEGQNETLRVSLGSSLGMLVLRADDGVTLRTDALGQGEGALSGEVSPGTHVVIASRGRRERTHEVVVPAGGRTELFIDSPPRGVSPWVWVVVGVLVAGGAATAIGLSLRSSGPSLPVDDVGT